MIWFFFDGDPTPSRPFPKSGAAGRGQSYQRSWAHISGVQSAGSLVQSAGESQVSGGKIMKIYRNRNKAR